MRHSPPRDRAARLKLHLARIDVVEQPCAVAEQEQNNVDLNCIEQTNSQILLASWLPA
jgi:hypothetical protein